jgi:Flp pilus assembly protein TadB
VTTTTTLAAALAAVAAAVGVGPRPGPARLRRIVSSQSTTRVGAAVADRPGSVGGPGAHRAVSGTRPEPGRGPLGSAPARVVAVAMVGFAAAWLVGGIAAPVAGIGVGAAAWVWLGRLESASVVRAREDAVAALPLTAELLAAAVAAGSPPVVAAEAVGRAVGGRLGSALATAAATARVGFEPSAAWASLAAEPVLRPLARALAGAGAHGVSPVAMLQRVAEDARDAARWDAQARARALGARAAAPLGLCFLPAFVLVGIVPVVAGAGPLLP